MEERRGDGGERAASWDTKSQSLEERHHTWRCGTVKRHLLLLLLLLPLVSQAKRGNRTSHIVQCLLLTSNVWVCSFGRQTDGKETGKFQT